MSHYRAKVSTNNVKCPILSRRECEPDQPRYRDEVEIQGVEARWGLNHPCTNPGSWWLAI